MNEETLLLPPTRYERSRKAGTRCGIVLMVLGVIGVVAAIVVPHIIVKTIHSRVIDTVTIRPGNLDTWANARRDNASPKFHNYNVFDITNAADVINNGSIPQYVQHGPFVYREYVMMYNNTFLEGNTQWQYNTYSTYEFQPDMSVAGGEAVQVTTVWNTMAALLKAFNGQTEGMYAGLAGPASLAVAETLAFAASKIAPACALDLYAHLGSLGGMPCAGVAANASVATSPTLMGIVQQINPFLHDVLVNSGVRVEYGFYAPTAADTLPGPRLEELLAGGPDYACPLGGNVPGSQVPCSLALLQGSVPQLFANLTAGQTTAAKALLQSGMFTLLAATFQQAGAIDPQHAPLLVKRTVRQLLFDFTDPLLTLLGRPSVKSNFVTSIADADTAWTLDKTATIVRTGTDDPAFSDYYIEWRDMRVLPASVWCTQPIPVQGMDDSTFPPSSLQFWSLKPNVGDASSFLVWVEDLFQPVLFSFYERYSYRGTIPLVRLTIAPEFYKANKATGQRYDGLVDMTCPLGAPILVSLPRFLRAELTEDYKWPVLPPISDAEGLTFLDVDPISGASLLGFKRLQVNMIVNAQVWPVFYDNEESQLTEKDYDEYREKILGNLHISTILLYVFFIAGGVSIVSGIMILVLLRSRARARRYLITNIE
eukprot:m.135520 g.135520  ORF g.135520 m.135520 type:complete len:653 (+) comp16562_c0_seq7:195-2153(+)